MDYRVYCNIFVLTVSITTVSLLLTNLYRGKEWVLKTVKPEFLAYFTKDTSINKDLNSFSITLRGRTQEGGNKYDNRHSSNGKKGLKERVRRHRAVQ